MLGRIAAAAIIVGGLMFDLAEAEAGPPISVSVPAVRVDFPRVSVEVRGHPPGPDYVWVEGYTTYDLFTNYKLTDDINVALTITNLTDVAYTPALSALGTGTSPVETGRGRTFLLTTRANF